MEVLEALQVVNSAIKSIAPAVAGPIGIVLRIVGVTMDAAIMIASSGKDPLKEIERIHDADPELQKMREAWSARIDEKFGPK